MEGALVRSLDPRQWTIFWANWVYTPPSCFFKMYLNIARLCIYRSWCGLFGTFFRLKFCVHFSSIHFVLKSCPSHQLWLDLFNDICNFSFCTLFQHPDTSLLLDRNIFHSIFFGHPRSIHVLSLGRERISHPYKSAIKITFCVFWPLHF
jgi:hypothetical protein